MLVGTEGIGAVRTVANILLYVCLSFIMINVGREFEVDKSRWKSYTQDYFIAMATATKKTENDRTFLILYRIC